MAKSPHPLAFISYVRTDQAIVEKLVRALRANGIEVWWDIDCLAPGDMWEERIREAITKGDAFIACFSKAYGDREHTQMQVELDIATKEMRKYKGSRAWFIPVQLDDTEIPALEIGFGKTLRDLQFVRMGEDWSTGVSRILAALGLTDRSSYSTGALIETVATGLSERISTGRIKSIEALAAAADEISNDFRAMLHLRHFARFGPGYPVDTWPASGEYLAHYLDGFRLWVRACNRELERILVHELSRCTNICITDYSRAILSGVSSLRENAGDYNITLVDRRHATLKRSEILELAATLRDLGFNVRTPLTLEQWLKYLDGIHHRFEKCDAILFGAEAVLSNGSILFPQKIDDREEAGLRNVALAHNHRYLDTNILCVAESYKFVSRQADDDARQLCAMSNFVSLGADLFTGYVCEHGTILSEASHQLQQTVKEVEEVCRSRMLSNYPQSARLIPFLLAPTPRLKRINTLVADIDDTITMEGKFSTKSVMALERISQLDLRVVLVTGRSAAWAQALFSYLPAVNAVIAENGGAVVYANEQIELLAEVDKASLDANAKKVRENFGLVASPDNQFRLTDRTSLRPAHTTEAILTEMGGLLESQYEIIASSIHIHVKLKGVDKATGLAKALARLGCGPIDCVLAVGDSANDKPLFQSQALSVGVANVRRYYGELGESLPEFVTQGSEADGFAEVVQRLCDVLPIAPHGGQTQRRDR